jgi:signal transduction histidine kinase
MSGRAVPDSTTDIARILLVDDEARNLDALESLLDSSEYTLVRALSAEAALRALLEHDFAAILMDVQMPTINGIELAALVKQRKRSQGIPIIFLTAHALDPADILRGYEAGAVDYLTKPLEPKILKTKIAVFVDLYKKKNELVRAEESLRLINAELEARVLERTDKLMQASRAKDDFLAALSHELRTPLNPVLLIASEAAEDASLSTQVRAWFSTIRTHIELEARLIDDLLDITRISHGKLSLNLEVIDIPAILKSAIETVQADFNEKQIRLDLDLADQDAKMNGDPVRLRQVLWNILKNAVKFTPVGGLVQISTMILGPAHKMIIQITDTGIGLTAEEIHSIFDAFSQGEHAAKRHLHQFGGLGLGLTISRMLVELHDGAIHASSPGRGHGATFTIELPILPLPLSLPGPAIPMTAQPEVGQVNLSQPSAGIRILLVEDHEPTRQVLTRLLTRRSHNVLSAMSLSEARTIAGREKLDLVISDIGLPDGDGYTLMAELRENFGLKGIALTGYGMEEDVARGKNAGFIGHLIKPIRMENLDEILRAYRQAIQSGEFEGQIN